MKHILFGGYVVIFSMLFSPSASCATKQKIALPMVSFAQVPLYPPLARAGNISGVVHVVVTTDGHRIVTAHAKDGHLWLKNAAEKNAMTWQFTIHEPTTFTVTYVYKLVDDLESQPDNPRVILRLPTDVEIDGQHWFEALHSPVSHPKGAPVSRSEDIQRSAR